MSSTGITGTQVNFISVMTPPLTAGEITLSLQSFDAATNLDLVLMVSVCGAEDEIALAKVIETQITTQLADYAYAGTPVFSSSPVPATYRVDRSDHVVTCWSQAATDITVTDNTCGAVIVINKSCPLLCTIGYFTGYAGTFSIDLTNADGDDLTNDDFCTIIEEFSQEVVSKLGSFVVLCTYLNSFIGGDEKIIFTGPTPGYSRDPLIVRHKSRGFSSEESAGISDNIIPYPTNLFTWIRSTGALNYRPQNNIVNMNLPWRRDNEVYMTIRAGFKFIPVAVKKAVVRLFALDATGESDFKELKGGDWSVTVDNTKLINSIYKSIVAYKTYSYE